MGVTANTSRARTGKRVRSAVTKVEKSGLDLVSSRKRRGKLATMRDIAKMNWEPWEKTERPGPSAETMDYLGFYSRVSAAIMTQTKAELMEVHAKLEHRAVDKMLAGIFDTAEKLKTLASMAEGAYARVLASASAHYLAGGKVKGVHDMRKKKRSLRLA